MSFSDMYFSHNLYNCCIDLISFVLLNGLLTLFNVFCFLAVYLGRRRVFKHCHIPDEDVWENCHLWGHLSVQPHWSTFPRYCAPACRRTGQIHRHGDGAGVVVMSSCAWWGLAMSPKRERGLAAPALRPHTLFDWPLSFLLCAPSFSSSLFYTEIPPSLSFILPGVQTECELKALCSLLLCCEGSCVSLCYKMNGWHKTEPSASTPHVGSSLYYQDDRFIWDPWGRRRRRKRNCWVSNQDMGDHRTIAYFFNPGLDVWIRFHSTD